MDLINLKVDDETIDLTINLLTGEAPGGSWTGAELLQGQLGSGNDNVTVGMQLYNLFGGAGTDSLTLDYSGALQDGQTATSIDLDAKRNTSTNQIINLSIDGSQVIRISEFESFNVTGTAGDDRILGGDAGNILIGGDGDDLLRGGTGIDILNGGDGDDVLDNAGVGDIVEGGAGMDLINLKVDDETID